MTTSLLSSNWLNMSSNASTGSADVLLTLQHALLLVFVLVSYHRWILSNHILEQGVIDRENNVASAFISHIGSIYSHIVLLAIYSIVFILWFQLDALILPVCMFFFVISFHPYLERKSR